MCQRFFAVINTESVSTRTASDDSEILYFTLVQIYFKTLDKTFYVLMLVNYEYSFMFKGLPNGISFTQISNSI
jgi:hypothetical protein